MHIFTIIIIYQHLLYFHFHQKYIQQHDISSQQASHFYSFGQDNCYPIHILLPASTTIQIDSICYIALYSCMSILLNSFYFNCQIYFLPNTPKTRTKQRNKKTSCGANNFYKTPVFSKKSYIFCHNVVGFSYTKVDGWTLLHLEYPIHMQIWTGDNKKLSFV